MHDQERSEGDSSGEHLDNPKPCPHSFDSESHEYPVPPTAPETKHQKVKNYWKHLLAEKPDRHIELLLTFAICFFAAVQLVITLSNNASTSRQSQHLLDAANRADDAADGFSSSAANISRGVSDAVGKLNLQAQSLKDSATQAARLAADTEVANRLAKAALESQSSTNRPILEIDELGPPSVSHDYGASLPSVGPVFQHGKTSFQFRIKNTGAGIAQHVQYAISQPYRVRWDIGISATRQIIERSIGNGGNQLGPSPVIRRLPDILGYGESDSLEVNLGNVIPPAPSKYDAGEFFYGELDWDDSVGFGHRWRRTLCFMAGIRNNDTATIADCGVNEEGVRIRDDSQDNSPRQSRGRASHLRTQTKDR